MPYADSDTADPASEKCWRKSGGSAPSRDPYFLHAHQWTCLSMDKTSVMQLISALMKEVVILSGKTQKIYSNNFNRASDWRAQKTRLLVSRVPANMDLPKKSDF